MHFLKRLLAGMTAGAAALTLLAAQEEVIFSQRPASASTVDMLYYEITDNEAVIIGYIEEPEYIEIPAEIEGYPVTTIGDSAFYYCTSMTGILIPDSVTSIEDDAFYYCSNLTEILIPDSVTSIGNSAFAFCSSLTEITIPDSVASIGDYAFYYCDSLIGFTVDSNNPYYCDVDGVLFSKDNSALLTYPPSKPDTSYAIPDFCINIRMFSFVGCNNLTEIIISDSLAEIEADAFNFCYSLAAFTVNDGNLYYSDINGVLYNKDKTVLYYFASGRTETSYVIPDSVVHIGDNAFYGCTEMTEIIIPDTVITIGNDAFFACYSLAEIILPDSLTSIGEGAFYSCDSITEIVIPDSVTNIGILAFTGCDGLTEVTLSASLTTLEYALFESCYSLTSIKIPDSVTKINRNVFSDCESLTEVVIPDSVTIIRDYAFNSCISLTQVTIPASVTEIGKNAFGYDMKDIKIEDFIICGYEGSAAEAYAALHAFNFVSLGNDPGTPSEEISGDPDGDGKITARDALYILQYAALSRTFTEEQFIAADVNGDGKVTPYDAQLILQYEAEFISSFPKG